jgi:hypothetical protein
VDAAPLAPDRLDAVLATLPPDWAVAQLGRDRLVAGRAGAFVLRPSTGEHHRDARRVTQLARATRTGLGDHLAWIPVIDALLVTPHRVLEPVGATVVELAMLTSLLQEGVQPLDEETLRRITGLMVERRLTPEWVPAGLAATADLLLPEA